jgi:pyrroloquinoline-quinone synthase
VAAAVSTLFVEGTRFERGELDPSADKRPEQPIEEHALVRHYGLDPKHLSLTRAHRQVEGEHRAAAWRVLLSHVPPHERSAVVAAMEQALAAWLCYRDDVAAACGLTR